MQDQVQHLLDKEIPALTFSSNNNESTKRLYYKGFSIKSIALFILELLSTPLICKLYYVTPEMLVRCEYFQNLLLKLMEKGLLERYDLCY